MKLPLILTGIIIAIGGAVDWALRAKMAAERLTVLPAERNEMDARSRSASGEKFRVAERAAGTRQLSSDLLAFAKELEAVTQPEDIGRLDARQEALLDWQRRLTGLEPGRMKELIAGIQNAGEISDKARQSLLRLMLEALCERHPMATLEIFSTMPDLLKEVGWKAQITAEAMVRGMGSDPEAVVGWYRKHRGMFPARTQDRITEKLLRGTGQSNAEAAFRLIQQLEIQDEAYAVGMITNPARDTTGRNAALAALRNHLATIDDPGKQAALRFEGNSSLISNAFTQGFDQGLEWMSRAGFSDKELEEYVSRVRRDLSGPGETRKWLDWVSGNIRSEQAVTEVFRSQVGDWTRADPGAAGAWLESAPDGDAKTAAAQGYAWTIAPYHPAKAAQWAATFPPGPDRDALINHVVSSWRNIDKPAADAFAEKHGIK